VSESGNHSLQSPLVAFQCPEVFGGALPPVGFRRRIVQRIEGREDRFTGIPDGNGPFIPLSNVIK
jgi:hypothetical protein